MEVESPLLLSRITTLSWRSISVMASTVDCFHDDSNDEDDSNVIDVEWTKLRTSHMKEGFRDGYSAGQEAVLQGAFNKGFTHQAKIEENTAYCKGVLMALKTFSEKVGNLRQHQQIGLTADITFRIETLLTQLESVSDSQQETSTEEVNKGEYSRTDPERKNTENVTERNGLHQSGCKCSQIVSEGVSAEAQTVCSQLESDSHKHYKESCCKTTPPSVSKDGCEEDGIGCHNPSGCNSQSFSAGVVTVGDGTSLSTAEANTHDPNFVIKDVTKKCKILLEELDMKELHGQFMRDY